MYSVKKNRRCGSLGQKLSYRDQAMWEIYTKIRWEAMGGICEVCGGRLDYLHIVGHHRNSSRSEGDHSYSNVEIRHPKCEKRSHYDFDGGKIPYFSPLRPDAVLYIYRIWLPYLYDTNKLYRQLYAEYPAPWALKRIKEDYHYSEVYQKVVRSRVLELRIKSDTPKLKEA